MTTKTYTVAVYRGHREGPNLVLTPDPNLIDHPYWRPASLTHIDLAHGYADWAQEALNLIMNQGRPPAYNATREDYRLFAVVTEGPPPERMAMRVWSTEGTEKADE